MLQVTRFYPFYGFIMFHRVYLQHFLCSSLGGQNHQCSKKPDSHVVSSIDTFQIRFLGGGGVDFQNDILQFKIANSLLPSHSGSAIARETHIYCIVALLQARYP